MTKWKKNTILLIILLVVLVGTYFIMVNILNNQLDELDANIKNETQKISDIEKSLVYYNEKLLNQDVNSFYKVLPSEIGISQFLVQLDGIASNEKVIILNMNLVGSSQVKDTEEGLEGTNILNISMTVNGNYLQVRSFIDELYKSERLISLKEFQWIEEDSLIYADLQLKVYYYPEVKGIINDLELIDTYKIDESRIDPTRY